MPLRFYILSISVFFTVHCNAQKTNYEIVEDFMEAMKAGDDLEPLINIPKTLQNSEYTINFYLVGEYDVQEINESTFEVIFSTGVTEKCISITLEIDTLSEGLLKAGKVQYQELLKKYIVDPWVETRKWCDEKPARVNSGEFTSLSGHFSGVLPNEFIMEADVSGDDIISYEYVVCEVDLKDYRYGYLVLYDPDRLKMLDKLIHQVFNISKEIAIPLDNVEWLDFFEGEMKGIKFDNSVISFVEYESYYAVMVFPDNAAGGIFFSMFTLNPLNFEFEFEVERDDDNEKWALLEVTYDGVIDTVYYGKDPSIYAIVESMEPVTYEFRTQGGKSKYIRLNPHLGFQLTDREYAVPMSIDLSSKASNYGRTFVLLYSEDEDDFVWELEQ